MKSKGLVAMLDAMLAYIIAFVTIGLVVVVMTNTQEADVKSTYSLNVWAEDIADAVGESCSWNEDNIPAVQENLQNSLNDIARNRRLSLKVTVGGTSIVNANYAYDVDEVVTATRFLIDGSTLEVEVGT